jgi:SAM-dependent methyltransferase
MTNFLYEIQDKDNVAVYCLDTYSYETILETNPNIKIVGGWPVQEEDWFQRTKQSKIRLYDTLDKLLMDRTGRESPNVFILLLRDTILIKEPFTMNYNHINIIKLYSEIKEKAANIKKIYVVCGKVFSQAVQNLLYTYAQIMELNISIVPYFDARYLLESPERMGWYCKKIDTVLEKEINKRKIAGKKILDIGSGSGEQAAALAHMGFQVVATDIVPYAFLKKNESPNIRFVVDNMISTGLDEKFDYILDRYAFHNYVIRLDQESYINNIYKALRDDGILYIYFRSDENEHSSDLNAYYYTEDSIIELFSEKFNIISFERVELCNELEEFLFNSFFCVMKKKTTRG